MSVERIAKVATGTFTVQPRPDTPAPPVPEIGRMLLGKTWSGDLTGQSVVEMLSFMTPVAGSGAYHGKCITPP